MSGIIIPTAFSMPHKHNRSKRHHIPKQRYKLNNWSDYNQALKNRGRLDLWFSNDIESWWHHEVRIYDGTGSSPLYTDQAILTCHEIRAIFKLPLRQVEGFINSLFEMLDLPLKCPNYTVLCRRLSTLNVSIPGDRKKPQHEDDTVAIAFDSTGLKRYGRDEWHQEKHKVASKRSWRKMHLAVGDDHFIYGAKLTDKDTMDEQVIDDLCEQIADVPVSQATGDMGYDQNHVYTSIQAHFPEADIVIPTKQHLNYNESNHPKRCSNMLEIAAKGMLSWQAAHHYGKRNSSEMAMQRYKRIFGVRLHAREMSNQEQEMMIACGVMNRFTAIGMPQSYRTR